MAVVWAGLAGVAVAGVQAMVGAEAAALVAAASARAAVVILVAAALQETGDVESYQTTCETPLA